MMRVWRLLIATLLVVGGLSTSGGVAAATTSSSSLATFTGTVSAGGVDTQSFRIDSGSVSLKRAFLLVSLEVQASDNGFNPGAVALSLAANANHSMKVIERQNVTGSTGTYILALIHLDTEYKVAVHGEAGSSGTYQAVVSMVGDVDGSGDVSTKDISLARHGLNATSASPRYQIAADVDRSGRITLADLGLIYANLGAAMNGTPPELQDNPLDEFLPDGAISVSGADPAALNALTAPVNFDLSGSSFDTSSDNTVVTANGQPLPSSQVVISDHRVALTGALTPGINDLRLISVDTLGRNLYGQVKLWAGDSDLQISVLSQQGTAFAGPATVTLKLVDDQTVSVESAVANGTATFHSVPPNTVTVTASAPGNLSGIAGGTGQQGQLTVVLTGINDPSTVANNDFSQGAAGWEIGTAPVEIIPHVDAAGPSADGSAAAAQTLAATDVTQRASADAAHRAKTATNATPTPNAIVDQDLSLGTSGEGQQSISRTFKTDPDTVAVRIKYRFVTSEVPGGYFGSQFNDYFRVSIRSATAGGSAQESNSMNGLGLPAFDAGGSTAWRDVELPVNFKGDTIQVDLAVANVADGLLDSQVVVDFVEELKVQVIPSLQWNPTTGGLDLKYEVKGEKPLPEARDITVTFGNGAGYANRIGPTLFTQTVPAQTAAGQYGPFHIEGAALDPDPAGTTHLIAAASERDVGSIPDVQVNYGANADAGAVSARMLDALKDSLRAAGQAAASVNSTARNAHDQARAMFNNLTNPNHTTAQNIATQHGIYGPPGDAVINTFANQTQGMTPAQIQADGPQIRAAMEAEINNQGCQAVTRHCADPAHESVVDVGAAVFNATNGPIFYAAMSGRVDNSIDERATNNCYHFEIAVP